METFFLACFVFGALFTVLSAVLGFAGSAIHGGHVGHVGNGGHAGHVGNGGAHAPAGHGAPTGHGHGHVGGDTLHGHQGDDGAAGHGRLPLLNMSTLVAFLTWFGAAGYLLLRLGAALVPALGGAVVAGALAGLLISLFLAKVQAGEREMDPEAYRLKGTIARVTVRIPAGGVGEIVFTKAGSRRSEAARSLSGEPIARETEVVIVDYARGVARVVPLEESLRRVQSRSDEPGQGASGASTER
jgi:hypothetical protein